MVYGLNVTDYIKVYNVKVKLEKKNWRDATPVVFFDWNVTVNIAKHCLVRLALVFASWFWTLELGFVKVLHKSDIPVIHYKVIIQSTANGRNQLLSKNLTSFDWLI